MVLAVLMLTARYLIVTAWVLGGDDESISGHVVATSPEGTLTWVCLSDGPRTLCGEIAPDKLAKAAGSVVVGDCVRMKVARGAALSVERAGFP